MSDKSGTGASGGKLQRDASIIGLLFASTTSMIGSGWLFGAYPRIEDRRAACASGAGWWAR